MALGDLRRLVFVTGVAGVFGIGRLVTGQAIGCGCTSVPQREGVIAQRGGHPGICCVAVLTAQAEGAAVDFRFLMALHALGGGAAEGLVFVAGSALDVGMPSVQGEDVGMVEAAHTVYAVVAGGAILSKLLDVRLHEGAIQALVAGNAGAGVESIQTLPVTGVTGQGAAIGVFTVTDERKARVLNVREGFAVQPCRNPSLRGVAGLAIGTEDAAVRIRFGVTGIAVRGKPPEDCRAPRVGFLRDPRCGIGVAIGAGGLGMLSFQGEGRLGVVEMCQAVDAIVARQAGFSEILCVPLDEGGIGLLVAGPAQSGLGGEIAFPVAGGALHGARLVIHLVHGQAEGGEFVVVCLTRRGGHVVVSAAVFVVAGAACLRVGETAVGTALGLDLGAYVFVAGEARICQGAVQGAVAGIALRLEIRVALETAQGDAGFALGAQRAGAENTVALQIKPHADEGENRNAEHKGSPREGRILVSHNVE